MIGLVSVNYKNAPVEVREKLYLNESDIVNISNKYLENDIVDGVYIISTCNRTEIYFENYFLNISESKVVHKVISILANFKKYTESISPYAEVKKNIEVINHIFCLASGLESMLIGEYQIVDQIKKSYNLSKENKFLSSNLDRLLQKSLNASKYVRSNTKIDKGAVSVSYAAVEKVNTYFKNKNIFITCIGLGETGQLTLQYLVKKNFKNITLMNRTLSKSKDLSEKFNVNFSKIGNLTSFIEKSDLVIFSTSNNNKLINEDNLTDIFKKRDKDLLIIDLSVPTNVSRSVDNINGINLVNIDNLKDEVNKNYKKRKDEIVLAKQFINKLVHDFSHWLNSKRKSNKNDSLKNLVDKKIDKTLQNFFMDKKVKLQTAKDIDMLKNELSKIYVELISNKLKI
tara:strand:- start:32802 stop:33998 length:1197 start_codon:yes stop_codon:yes gene_type:complete